MTPNSRGATAPPLRQHQCGAALLTALLIVVLVTTLASAMLWRQARSIQIESAERGRAQAEWVLQGALDWARLILREDGRGKNGQNSTDNLGEVWAVPLAEAQLSSFLSTNENHSADGAPEAFLSGHIEDAQALYNINNLITTEDNKATAETRLQVARKIFQQAGLSASLADQVQTRISDAANKADSGETLLPTRVEQLTWLGLSKEQVERLRPLVIVLPGKVTTMVNLNTAPREVIASLADGMSLPIADSIIRARETKPCESLDGFKTYVGDVKLSDVATCKTAYFYVIGQLRMEDRLITMRSLVNRPSLDATVVDREYLQQSTALPTSSSSSR